MGAPDRAPEPTRRAVALAGHTGDETTVRSGLDHPDAGVRATALGAAARLGILVPAWLDRAATDRDPKVRARAAELSAAGGEGAVPRLLRLLDDRATVTEAACFALGELGPAGAAAVAALAHVATDHTDPLCREAAVAALGAIGDGAGLAAVLAATDDKPAVRRRAVLALAAFEGAAIDAALERALVDRDWQVRQAAEDLLGR